MSYPIGSIISRARNSSLRSLSQIWAGFLLCDGSTYLKSDYPDLYTKFSDDKITIQDNNYGINSDKDKFKVPNLSDYTPCMVNSDNTSAQLGETSGNLTSSTNKYLLPTHNHSFSLTSEHKHSFIYRGFNQGYNQGLISGFQEQGSQELYPAFKQSSFTLPTSLNTTITEQGIDYQVGEYGTSSSQTVQLQITNSYVGVDYYIKY